MSEHLDTFGIYPIPMFNHYDISYHDVALWKCILEDTPILRPTKVWIKFASLRAWRAPRLCLGKFLLGDFQGIGHRLEMIIRIWVGHLSAAVLEMAPLIFFCGCCLVLIAMFFGNPVGKKWYQLISTGIPVKFSCCCDAWLLLLTLNWHQLTDWWS